MNQAAKIVKNEFSKEGELFFLRKNTNELMGKIDIEIIDNDIESETGMMYRNNIGHHQGMLFIFKECSERSFWMKNTEVALDIIFADSSKKINKIYSDAKPLSEEFLPSLNAVKYTIEVKAGYCSGMGISEGDLFSYSFKMPGNTQYCPKIFL